MVSGVDIRMITHKTCGTRLQYKTSDTPLDFGYGRECISYMWCWDCKREVPFEEQKIGNNNE